VHLFLFFNISIRHHLWIYKIFIMRNFTNEQLYKCTFLIISVQLFLFTYISTCHHHWTYNFFINNCVEKTIRYKCYQSYPFNNKKQSQSLIFPGLNKQINISLVLVVLTRRSYLRVIIGQGIFIIIIIMILLSLLLLLLLLFYYYYYHYY